MIEIKLSKNYNLKGYTLIEGFPGAGLVGPMAASYIVEKLSMEYIGDISSDSFPPIAAIHNGIPMYTARLYMDEKRKLLVMLAEFTIPTNVVYALGMEIISFIRKYGIKNVISIGGLPMQQPGNNAYIISSDEDFGKQAKKQGIKNIQEGVIAGVSAILLVNAVHYNIPVADILVEVNPAILNPKYAEIAIMTLDKLIGIEIDLRELEKESKVVEAKVKDMLGKAKETHDRYSKSAEPAGPPTYA